MMFASILPQFALDPNTLVTGIFVLGFANTLALVGIAVKFGFTLGTMSESLRNLASSVDRLEIAASSAVAVAADVANLKESVRLLQSSRDA